MLALNTALLWIKRCCVKEYVFRKLLIIPWDISAVQFIFCIFKSWWLSMNNFLETFQIYYSSWFLQKQRKYNFVRINKKTKNIVLWKNGYGTSTLQARRYNGQSQWVLLIFTSKVLKTFGCVFYHITTLIKNFFHHLRQINLRILHLS